MTSKNNNGGALTPIEMAEREIARLRAADHSPLAGHDKRKHDRVRFPGRVRLRAAGTSDLERTFSQNLSEGGLFVQTERPFPVGREVHLEVIDRKQRCLFEARARVAWIRLPQPGVNQTPGMGLQFIELSPEARVVVDRFCGVALDKVEPKSCEEVPAEAPAEPPPEAPAEPPPPEPTEPVSTESMPARPAPRCLEGKLKKVACIEDAIEGHDENLSVTGLIFMAHRLRIDCTIEIEEWKLEFNKKGQILGFATPSNDGILPQLVRSKKLRKYKADELLKETDGDHRAAESLAVERNIVAPAQLLVAGLRQLLYSHAGEFVKQVDVPFRLSPGLKKEPILALNVETMMLDLVKRALGPVDPQLIEAHVEERMDKPVMLSRKAMAQMKKVKLERRLRRLVDLLDGNLTLYEVRRKCPVPTAMLCQLLVLLDGMSFLAST